MREKETGIIINSKAGTKQERNRILKAVIDTFQEVQTFDLADLENGRIKSIPARLAIIGGDGTIRASISWLASHNEYPQILIAGGGSTNTFKTALIQEGVKTSIKSFKNAQEQTAPFYPAVIENTDGKKDFWVISAGFGNFERDFADAFEEIRKSKIPHFTRAHIAGIVALMQNILSGRYSQESLLRVYATSQRIGPFKVFKENELNLSSHKLGLVEIEKKDYYWGILKFFLASVFWQARIKSPKLLVTTMIKESFLEKIKESKDTLINLDGDNKKIKPGKSTIKRHVQSFPVSALVWERKKQIF